MAKKTLLLGDTVIFVHDTDDLKIGDTSIIKGFCKQCNGLILDNSEKHHNRSDVELHLKKEPIVLNRQQLYDSMTRLHARLLHGSHQGLMNADEVKRLVFQFYSEIDIKEDYLKSIY